MRGRSKSLVLILMLAMAISSLTVLMIEPVNADIKAAPKPSSPEFTIKVVSHPYDVPQETSIDPYTGKTVITQQGAHVENKSIEITIKNQEYTYSDSNSSYWIVYNVRYKGHFGNEWTEQYRHSAYIYQSLPYQASGQYTTLNIPLYNFASDSQIDFQVQAYAEYSTEVMIYPHIQGPGEPVSGYGIAAGSGWSNIQTINLTDSSTSISTSYNPTPPPTQIPASVPTGTPNNPTAAPTTNNNQTQATDTVPLTTFAAVVIALVAIIAIMIGVLLSKKRKQ